MASPQPSEICGKPREQAGRLLSAARQAGDRWREAAALTDLGVAHLHAAEYQAAIRHFEESLTLSVQVGDPAQESDARANLGLAFLGADHPERAREILEQQVAEAKERHDLYEEKLALDNLGAVYVKLCDYGHALALYGQALALARQAGDRQHQADLLWIIAIQHAELEQWDQAVASGQAAIGIYEQIGSPNVREFVNALKDFSTLSAGPTTSEDGPQPLGYYTGPGSQRRQEKGPGLLWMAFSAAKSMAKFIGSGFKTVAASTQEKRLRICGTCPYHTGARCRLCGCFTSIKAWLPHERCPTGRWD